MVGIQNHLKSVILFTVLFYKTHFSIIQHKYLDSLSCL
jgi:hypothetical protein